jgi:hypothetical protein
MSTQNEGKELKESSHQQSMPDGEGNPGNPGNPGNVGSGNTGTTGQPGASQGNQQAEMPPSQTDDDQYDQGTVRRTP